MKNLLSNVSFRRAVALGAGILSSATLLLACDNASQWDGPIVKDVFSKHALGLTLAQDCDAYKAYLIDTKAMDYAKQQYLSYRWMTDDDINVGFPEGDSKDAGEYTTTNLQEEGVDEMDILKNDGSHMFVMENDGVRIVKSWPAADLKQVAQIEFVKEKGFDGSYGRGLLLLGKRLIVFRSAYQMDREGYPDMPMGMPFYYRSRTVFYVDVYDVSKPEAPTRLQSSRFDGDFNTARSVNGRIYAIIDSQLDTSYFDKLLQSADLKAALPSLPKDEVFWNMSEAERQSYVDKAFPIIRNFLIEKTADLKMESILPVYQQDKAGKKNERVLLTCQNIYMPKTASQHPGLMSLIEFSGDDYSQIYASAIADSAWLVYASKENFYAVSSSYNWYWSCVSDNECKNYSHIHRFNYKGKDGHIQYANSGEIEGIVQDSFWMSEHKGHLRLASQDQAWGGNNKGSSLSVLSIDGSAMNQVGRVDGIAPGERIFASRMFGDKGYLVTFKQVDPLFSIDLSNPKAPKIMGELKINGYSSYIHPLDENRLLTIGRDADSEGRDLGLQLQIFDVSDMKNPKRSHQYLIATDGPQSYTSSAALYDHHAFSFHAPSGLLAIPMNVYKWSHWMENSNFSGMIILKVTADKGFEEIGLIDHSEFKLDPNAWWDELRRSRFMFKTAGVYNEDAFVYTLSGQGMKVSNANKPSEEVARIAF